MNVQKYKELIAPAEAEHAETKQKARKAYMEAMTKANEKLRNSIRTAKEASQGKVLD